MAQVDVNLCFVSFLIHFSTSQVRAASQTSAERCFPFILHHLCSFGLVCATVAMLDLTCGFSLKMERVMQGYFPKLQHIA